MFQKINHLEMREAYGMINLTEFSFEQTSQPETEILERFIHSDYCYNECKTDNQRADSNVGLGWPFKRELLSIIDFRKMDADSMRAYLSTLVSNPEWGIDNNGWGVDRRSTLNLIDRFKQLQKSENQTYYVLDLEWLYDQYPGISTINIKDPRLQGPHWCYDYYRMIIWIDKGKDTITFSEWFYD